MAKTGQMTQKRPPTAIALALISVGATCEQPRPRHELAASGVRVHRLTAAGAARGFDSGGTGLTTTVAAEGDYLLRGRELSVLVGGLGREGRARGAVLAAAIDGAPAEDGIVMLESTVWIGDRVAAIEVGSMEVVRREHGPALRIEGTVPLDGGVIRVYREFSLGRVATALSVTTRLERDGPALRVAVGHRIGWGGGAPFVPGEGRVAAAGDRLAQWVARDGEVAASVFAMHDQTLVVRPTFQQHGSATFASHTEVRGPWGRVGDGRSLVGRAEWVAARGGLAAAVRRLGWAWGRPFPERSVWARPLVAGLKVLLTDREGHPFLSGRPDPRGHVMMPLTTGLPSDDPRGRAAILQLVATAFGYSPSDPHPIDGAAGPPIALTLPAGGQVRFVVQDADGQPLLARLRIRGINGTKSPALGPEHRAEGAVETVLTLDGQVDVPLPPGWYEVVVSHGPEWSLHAETVRVTESLAPTVLAKLHAEVDPGDWVSADLHLHAAPSYDSQVSLEDRVVTLLAEGVRFAVPTDHNHVTSYEAAIAALAPGAMGTASGVEVTTWNPAFGHFNAFPVPYRADRAQGGAPPYQRLSPSRLFAALHDLGDDVLVQVNHPRLEPDIGYFDLMSFDPETGRAGGPYSDDYDLLEVWNGFDLDRIELFERVFGDWMAMLERGERHVATGSSDSHRVHMQWAGYPRTYIRVAASSHGDPAAVLNSLRHGHAFVSSGPFLEVAVAGAVAAESGDDGTTSGADGAAGDEGIPTSAGPGDSVVVAALPFDVSVRVQAPSWMDVARIEIYCGRQRVSTAAISPSQGAPAVLRFEGAIATACSLPAPLVVMARGDEPMRALLARDEALPIAFSNPIWVLPPSP